jgi:hypothetical protein
MFGASDSSDRRRAGWRGVFDRLLEMTRLVPARPQGPPVEPVHRTPPPPGQRPPLGAERELHEQQHVNPLRADEHRHEQQ